ncbi:MAG: hypothetical protein ACRD2Z_04600 [Thermoanaerobaculia bacterium]
MDDSHLRQLLEALEAEGVRYAIFGATALNLLGLPRATQDVDVFLAPEEDNVARLRRALHRVFDDPHIDEITAEDLLGAYPAVQYVPPDSGFHVDILTRLGEAFRFADLETQRIRFADLEVTVVTPRQLYEMKRDTVRWKDRGDAERLRERFDLKDD